MNKTILLFGLILFIGSFGLQSCIIEGCTDEDAINYDSEATDDDGSCEYEGEAIFWTDWDYGVGNISVYVEGTYVGQITSYYSSSTPDCGASGCVTITREPGYYSFTASATGASWDWGVTIYANDCSTMRLYVSKDGVPKVAKEPHGSFNTFQPEPLKN